MTQIGRHALYSGRCGAFIAKTQKFDNMKWINLMTVFLMLGCGQQLEQLSIDEIEQIKNDIIKRSEKHANDLVNLDYKSVMTFYSEDLIVFGDGNYWALPSIKNQNPPLQRVLGISVGPRGIEPRTP